MMAPRVLITNTSLDARCAEEAAAAWGESLDLTASDIFGRRSASSLRGSPPPARELALHFRRLICGGLGETRP